jgi:putative redox protein
MEELRPRCLRRSKAEPQTNLSSHIASHHATLRVRCSMDNWDIFATFCGNRWENRDESPVLRQIGANMKTRIKWVEGVSFVGETGSGHAVVIDGAPENGGRNLGMRPMEMVLTGAAACTAFDVVLILKKGRQPVADCVVTAEAERAEQEPRVFTRIHLVYAVAGRGLDARQVERAVKLSKEKYCSATIMLAKSAEITYEIAITEGDRVPAQG